MQEQADRVGLTFERISAVNGADVPTWLTEEFSRPHKMSSGQVGCYASHLVAAQMIVARQLPFAVVIEDDAEIDPDLVDVTLEAVRAMPADWDYLHLSSRFKKSVIRVADVNNRSLIRYSVWPSGTVGYALSNRGARKWLNPMPRIRPNDLDNRFAWQQHLRVFGIDPPPIKHNFDLRSEVGRHGPRPHWEPPMVSRFFGYLWSVKELGVWNYIRAEFMNLVNAARKRWDGKTRVARI